MVEHVDDAGVRAGAEHDQPLVADVHREEALVHHQRIRPPRRVFRDPAHLVGEALLVGGDAGDFAADVEQVVEAGERGGRDDGFGAEGAPLLGRGDALHRQDAAVRLAHAKFIEHAGMEVERHVARAVRGADHAERARDAARMVPVAVREHRGVDRAELDAEAGAVAFHRVIDGAAVEQHRPLPVRAVRGDDEGKAVIGAAEAPAREEAHALLLQAVPFAGDELGCGGEGVGDVVDEDEDVEAGGGG